MGAKSRKGIGGRPRKVNQTIVGKLEVAFSIGANISQACMVAGISRDCYYDFLKHDPNYSDRFELLRQEPVLKAKRNIAEAIASGDVVVSRWFLERCDPKYSAKTQVDMNAKEPVQAEDEILKKLSELLGPGALKLVT